MNELDDTHALSDQTDFDVAGTEVIARTSSTRISSSVHSKKLAVLLLLLATWFISINAFVSTGPPNEPVELLLMGALFAQPLLFAVWMVMGPGTAVKRIPLTLTSFVILMLAGKLNVWEWLDRGDSFGSRFLIPGLALLGLSAAALWIVRWRTGWQIRRLPTSACEHSSANQFGLKFLLGWTTVCAVLLVAARGQLFRGLPNGTLLMVSSGLAILMLLPALCAPLIVLFPRPVGRLMWLAPLLWCAITWLAIETITATATTFDFEPDEWGQVALTVIIGQSGALVVGLLASIMLRLAGYRLTGNASARANAPVSITTT
jgi:hypothetical protein